MLAPSCALRFSQPAAAAAAAASGFARIFDSAGSNSNSGSDSFDPRPPPEEIRALSSPSLRERLMPAGSLRHRVCYNRLTNPSPMDTAMSELRRAHAQRCSLGALLAPPASDARCSSSLRHVVLRLAELAYALPHNNDANAAAIVREMCARDARLRGMLGAHAEPVAATSDFVVFAYRHRRACYTLVAASRGTHLGEASWHRDLADACVLGAERRVDALDRAIEQQRELHGAGAVHRVLVIGHSLSGAVVLRYCARKQQQQQQQQERELDRPELFGVAVNPGEIGMSVPGLAARGVLFEDDACGADDAPEGRRVPLRDRVVVLRKPFDPITRFVEPRGTTIINETEDADAHRLVAFRPRAEDLEPLLAARDFAAWVHFALLSMLLCCAVCWCCGSVIGLPSSIGRNGDTGERGARRAAV